MAYVVEFEKELQNKNDFELTFKERVFFTSKSNAISWIRDIKKFDKNITFKNFKIKEITNENVLPA